MGDNAKVHLNSKIKSSRSVLYYPAPVLYLGALLALAGALAPALYWMWDGRLHFPFSRYVDRALMISALVLWVPYFVKVRAALGLNWRKSSKDDFCVGLVLSLASIGIIVAAHLVFGLRTWIGSYPASALLGILPVALIVALIEEPIFRGGVQQALVSRLGMVAGWLAASVFFAIVHFLKVPREFAPQPVTWTSGYEAIGLALGPLANPQTYGAMFFSLLIVGLILGAMYLKTQSLWLPIGLHAGWVAGLKLTSASTLPTAHATGWAGGADLLTGRLTAVVLALLGWALWRLYPGTTSELPSKSGD